MMKWRKTILNITGTGSLIGTIIAILWLLSRQAALPGRRSPPLWISWVTALALLYGLSVSSAWIRRQAQRSATSRKRRSRRVTIFLLNALIADPLLTLWFRLLLAIMVHLELSSVERWFLAFGLAWITTPFVALWFLSVGAGLEAWLARP
jgi:hypothetical protein